MKKIHLLFVASTVGLSILGSGCTSTPLTPEEKEAYARDKAMMQYQNEQQLNQMESLTDENTAGENQIYP